MPHRLPIVDQVAKPAPRRRHPSWLRVKMPGGDGYRDIDRTLKKLGLNTVCKSAGCPNIGECWNNRALTIMILGDICTRSCRFCDVKTGRPLPVDEDEPRRVATMLAALDLNHTVITSVDRDDLKDGGAGIWAATLGACHELAPQMTVEVLVPDFKGQVQARYDRSFAVLKRARERGALTKTGLMLGLGEELSEVREVIDQLGDFGLTILTLGQYLQPSKKHLPISRYVHPDEFAELKEYALSRGIDHVESGPLVRSSYHAEGQAELIRRLQADHGKIGFASLRPE